MRDNWGYDKEQKPDIVEVVRCKDCEHYKPFVDQCGLPYENDVMGGIGMCKITMLVIYDKYFCAVGKKGESDVQITNDTGRETL